MCEEYELELCLEKKAGDYIAHYMMLIQQPESNAMYLYAHPESSELHFTTRSSNDDIRCKYDQGYMKL